MQKQILQLSSQEPDTEKMCITCKTTPLFSLRFYIFLKNLYLLFIKNRLGGSDSKDLPVMQETQVQSLSREVTMVTRHGLIVLF